MADESRAKVEVEDRGGSWKIAVFFTLLLACSQTPAQRAEQDLNSIRQETNAATLVERGKAFAALGDHTRAEEYLASALDVGADPRDVLPILVDVCVKTGRYRSAIQHGENQLRKHPHDLQTRVMVGALYVALNDSKQARTQLEHIIPKPEDAPLADAGGALAEPPSRIRAEAHYLLGVVSRDSDNDLVDADRHFREYLKLEPKGSHAEEAKASLLKRIPQ